MPAWGPLNSGPDRIPLLRRSPSALGRLYTTLGWRSGRVASHMKNSFSVAVMVSMLAVASFAQQTQYAAHRILTDNYYNMSGKWIPISCEVMGHDCSHEKTDLASELAGNGIDEVRCLKDQGLCILAHVRTTLQGGVPYAEMYHFLISKWDGAGVEARAVNDNPFSCDKQNPQTDVLHITFQPEAADGVTLRRKSVNRDYWTVERKNCGVQVEIYQFVADSGFLR